MISSSDQIHADEKAITNSITSCIANGERLIADAYQVEFEKPPATKLILSLIAQEEFAKAFLMLMVRENIIPWNQYLWRATKDHSCKQLVGVIIDYLTPELANLEDIQLWAKREVALGDEAIPEDVASAIDILRHEKIGRWESKSWDWVTPPEYDATVKKIAEGHRDRLKQNASYVRISKDARVLGTPNDVAPAMVAKEFERAATYGRFMKSLMEGENKRSQEFEKISRFLKAVFMASNK